MEGISRPLAQEVGSYTEGGEARAPSDRPFFTIVIPMFNRERFIGRALESCSRQTFGDWEAVVVDDCSCDGSAGVAARFPDSRVRLIRHEQNRGVCPARSSGVDAARGAWLIFLDSDDELVPGSLQVMYDAATRAASDVQRLVFSLTDEAGALSPQPPLANGVVWSYRQYVEWADQTTTRSDFMNCIRRSVFDSVSWPDGRALEALFHFDLARRFKTECRAEVTGIVHRDAQNHSRALNADLRLRAAADRAGATLRLLHSHGEALRAWAPKSFAGFLRDACVNSFMAGQWRSGINSALTLLRFRPFALSSWAALPLAISGRRGTARAIALKDRISRWQTAMRDRRSEG